jgi:hypothetical protein
MEVLLLLAGRRVKRSRLISDITSRVDKLRKREDVGAGFLAVEDSSELIEVSF